MPKKNVWDKMKSGFKQKARGARKDFSQHMKIGKGSIDSRMGGKLKGNGKI